MFPVALPAPVLVLASLPVALAHLKFMADLRAVAAVASTTTEFSLRAEIRGLGRDNASAARGWIKEVGVKRSVDVRDVFVEHSAVDPMPSVVELDIEPIVALSPCDSPA